MGIIIELKNVRKSFQSQEVLKGVNLQIEAGAVYGVIGYNGSGKTVMFKCICGFLKPDEGEILVEGKRIGYDVDFPESIGILIENPGFIPYLSGFNNLKKLASIRRTITDDRIREVMKLVGLEWDSKKKVSHYSMGMRERLGIAQAIMELPKIIILDEPFNGLDKDGAKELSQIFIELKKTGTTILIADHHVKELHGLCDWILEMDKGVITKWKKEEFCV